MRKILVMGLMMGMARAALAGTPTITVYGEEMVVTATRVEKGIGDVPVSASVVTKEEMEKKARVTFVDEVLRYEAGVTQKRRKFADAMSQNTLRGFSGNQRTLVLLDGMPMSDAYSGGTYLGNLPVGNVERIEVAKGPFSSLYGGEAMGGVINIITKTPQKEEFEAQSSVSNFNTCCHILRLGNKIGKLGFTVNLEKKTSEGDRTDLVTKSVTLGGTSTTKVTGWTKTTDNKGSSTCLIGDKGKNYWDQNQYGCKLSYTINQASNLSFSFKGNRQEYGYRDPQSSLVDAGGKPVDNGKVEFSGEGAATISQKDFLSTWGEDENNTYGLGYDTLLGAIALKGRLNLINADSFYVSPETGANYSGGPGKLSKTSPRDTFFSEVQVDIPLMESNLITGGLSFRNDSANAHDWKVSNWKDESSAAGNATYEVGGKARTVALYTQGEVQLLPSLKLFPGARYDMWKRYDADLVDGTKSTRYADRDDSTFSPKIGLLYKPEFEKGLYRLDGLRASWGKAFRPPTTFELYRTWTSGGITYVSNPELSPETTQSWEIGIDQHLGRIALCATYFQSQINDLIYSNWVTGTYSVKENGGGKIAGFEIEGKMKIAEGWNAFANYTLQDTEFTSNSADPKIVGKDFEYVPERLANIGLSFHKNALDASCNWHFADKMYAKSDNIDVVEGVYGAWDKVNTVDMKLGYSLKKDMRLSLACDNLLDREYFQYYKSPGRTMTVEMGCKY